MTTAWPLVGRAEELELLRDALEQARGVVLSGAAGVGKSRLAAEALDQVARTGSWRVVALTAGAEAAAVPFAPFVPLLGDDVSGDAVERFHRAARALAALGPKVVLALDDAHLLDEVSVAFVRHLVATSDTRLVLTVRSGAPAPSTLVALWQGGLLRRVEVLALARQETEDLVRRVLGDTVDPLVLRWIWETTNGNALFVHELVVDAQERRSLVRRRDRWVLDGEPSGAGSRLQEIVASRVGSLAEDEREALELVALGEPLGLSFLEELVGRDVVARLDERGLLSGASKRRRMPVRLSHPLHGEVVRSTMTVTAGRIRRRRLIDATAATGARRPLDAVRLAIWRCEVGDLGDWQAMLDAAEELAWAGDRVLVSALRGSGVRGVVPSVGHLEQAAALARGALDGGGSVRAAALLVRLLTLLDRNDEAAEVHTEATRLAVDEADELALVRVRTGVGLFDRGDGAAARSLLQAFGERVVDPDVRTAANASLALMTALSGPPRDALDLARSVLESGGGTAGDRLTATAAAAVSLGEVARVGEALELVDAAVEVLASDLGPDLAVALSLVRTLLLATDGRLVEAESLCRHCYAVAAESGDGAVMGTFAALGAQIALERGHAAAAGALASEAVERVEPVDPYGVRRVALALRLHAASLGASTGAADAARAELDASTAAMAQRSQEQRARAWYDVAGGRASLAVARLQAAAETLAATGHIVREAAALHDLVRLGHAGVAVARLGELAVESDAAVVVTMAEQASAAVAGDAAGLMVAGEQWSERGFDLFAAEAFSHAASRWEREGRRTLAGSARARRTQALALCGAVATPALSLTAAAAALTSREREIAGLAARGLNDRDIAGLLVVSVRTVHTHLYNVYAKLGVDGRAALAGALDDA